MNYLTSISPYYLKTYGNLQRISEGGRGGREGGRGGFFWINQPWLTFSVNFLCFNCYFQKKKKKKLSCNRFFIIIRWKKEAGQCLKSTIVNTKSPLKIMKKREVITLDWFTSYVWVLKQQVQHCNCFFKTNDSLMEHLVWLQIR